jgi:hypothetical protein
MDQLNHDAGRGIGVYHCFCDEYSSIETLKEPDHICYSYQYEHYFGKFFTWIIALIIVLSNSIIEKIFHFLTLKIGYKYKS